MLRVALIGAGAMGMNHARVLGQSSRAEVDIVVDPDGERAERLAVAAGSRALMTPDAALEADAVIIASPTETHRELALPLIESGIPVLVEKPIAADLHDVRAILSAAERNNVPLMCGFVERFNPAVEAARSLLDGEPHHLVAVRHSPETPRIRTSVVFDLLIHDIDLAFLLGPGGGCRTQSTAWHRPDTEVKEIADCTLTFDGGMLATLSSSRASQRKIRTVTIATNRSLLELDLLRADLSVYRHVRHEQLVDEGTTYRAETIMDIPFVRHAGEPIALQLDHFLDLVEGHADPEAERASLVGPHEIAAAVEGSGA